MTVPALPPGFIGRLAVLAGIQVCGDGHKHPLSCPFHSDKHPSAFLDVERNVFFCSVCTPDGGWSAKRLADALGIDFHRVLGDALPLIGQNRPPRRPPRAPSTPTKPRFEPHDAAAAWTVFEACARDDTRVLEDALPYGYLQRRGLLDAWEERAFGIVPDEPTLPGSTRTWRRRGYAIAAPLYDEHGQLCNVQSRALGDQRPKTLFPTGSCAKGLTFANQAGLALLRGDTTFPVVLLAEGLTDHLALSMTGALPVLSTPGTGSAASCVSSWATGRAVVLGLDADEAGAAALGPARDAAYRAGAAMVFDLTWPCHARDACDALQALGPDDLARFLARVVSEADHA